MSLLQTAALLAAAPHWSDHVACHGPLPASSPEEILAAADAAQIRGRGGGGFPLGRKLRSAAEHGGGTVIGNCAEGEPASHKDLALLETAPHLVVDGALLAARAVRAKRVVLAAHEGTAARRVRAALAERDDVRRVEVLELPRRYVAGEASSLVRALHGGPALPRQRPAPLATGRRPHLVQNAETLACLALVARGERLTSSLLTVGGAVVRPGVIEVELGTTLRAVVDACGGFLEPVQAVLVGGYFGRWLPADVALDAVLTVDGMRAVGGVLGAGIVLALPASACGLAATAQVLRYLADQSARQCGPCLNGLPAMATALEQLAAGRATTDVVAQLGRWAGLVTGRGACAHPDGAAALLTSALQVFAADVGRHERGSCGRGPGRWLEVPR
jgi:NADH:ubiquinone oxidoreductase subunit F (NADH-binding)